MFELVTFLFKCSLAHKLACFTVKNSFIINPRLLTQLIAILYYLLMSQNKTDEVPKFGYEQQYSMKNLYN